MRSLRLSIGLGITLLSLSQVSAQIIIFNIANGDITALKNALTSSNSDGKDDIINLANNGTYTLTAADNSTNGPTGLPVITADGGHSVTINGHGSTITRSGSNQLRFLQTGSGATLNINNLTLNNGSAILTPGVGIAAGAAIYNNGGSLSLTSCTFSLNAVKGANGANGVSAEPNANPGDSGGGGAISSSGSLTANGCTFINNSAQGGNGGNGFGASGVGGNGGNGYGGAIDSDSATIVDCTFTGNAASIGTAGSGGGGNGNPGLAGGGAIVFSGGSSSATHCSFDSNTAYGLVGGFIQYPGQGGAIDFEAFLSQAPGVVECSFTNNHADYAGAVIGVQASGCLFSGNGATAGGGAVASLGGNLFFAGVSTSATNCTFYNNIAPYGGAVYSDAANNQNTVTNCTLVHNTGTTAAGSIYQNAVLTNNILQTGSPTNFSGDSVTSQGHNICDDAAEGDNGTGPGGDLNATGDMRNTSPQLLTSTPQNNGGPTQTFALLLNSPAINHGDDTKAPKRDQRGNFRTGVSDIGAYEYQGGLIAPGDISRSGSDITVSAAVAYGHTYRLERKIDLSFANWNAIDGVNEFVATGNDTESVIAPGDLSLGKAFYHITCVQ